jgi:hypothetical protein
VRPRQGPPAHLGVHPHPARHHRLGGQRVLPVAQLADVEVAGAAVRTGGPLPAEEDVAGRLGQPLPGHHPLPLVRELAGPGEPAQHRLLRFLHLQEQRVLRIPAEQQDDPAAGAHAADPYHLAGHVGELELPEQRPPVRLQAAPVRTDQCPESSFGIDTAQLLRDQIGDRDDQRRVGHDPGPAVDPAGELAEFLPAVPGAGLGHGPLQRPPLAAAHLVLEVAHDRVRVGVRVPDVQVALPGEPAHRLPVLADRRQHDRGALAAGEPVAPGRDLQAGGQPLDVPLPRRWQGLVEVVDVEDQRALGGGEQPEVGQVRVTAGLHQQAGGGGAGQVEGHRQGRAAEVAELRREHPPVPDRYQVRQPGRGLFRQQADRVRAVPAAG